MTLGAHLAVFSTYPALPSHREPHCLSATMSLSTDKWQNLMISGHYILLEFRSKLGYVPAKPGGPAYPPMGTANVSKTAQPKSNLSLFIFHFEQLLTNGHCDRHRNLSTSLAHRLTATTGPRRGASLTQRPMYRAAQIPELGELPPGLPHTHASEYPSPPARTRQFSERRACKMRAPMRRDYRASS